MRLQFHLLCHTFPLLLKAHINERVSEDDRKVAGTFGECGLHPGNVTLHSVLCPTSRGSAMRRLSDMTSDRDT